MKSKTSTATVSRKGWIAAIAGGAALVLGVAAYFSMSGKSAPEEAPDWLEIKQVRTGDTLALENNEKLMYRGVQAPAEGEALFDEARQRNEALLKDQKARVRYEQQAERDKKERLLGYVFVNKKLINAELVREGLAYVRITADTTRYNQELLAAAAEARKARKGIWAQPAPQIDPQYWADPKYGLFHREHCQEKAKAKAERIQTLKTRVEGFDRGWAPCRECRP